MLAEPRDQGCPREPVDLDIGQGLVNAEEPERVLASEAHEFQQLLQLPEAPVDVADDDVPGCRHAFGAGARTSRMSPSCATLATRRPPESKI